jgi:formylglycine-generating enzyme required for sulfatase activity
MNTPGLRICVLALAASLAVGGCDVFLGEYGGPGQPCFLDGVPCDGDLICGPSGLCELPGTEGKPCFQDHTCIGGLDCAADSVCRADVGQLGEICFYGDTCSGGLVCLVDQTCCQPDCAGKECGDNGCGATCGSCGQGEWCQQGACEAVVDWVQIPGGTGVMGDDAHGVDYAPKHSVTLATFYLSHTEITVAEYQACIAAGNCSTTATDQEDCNWIHPDRPDYPMNCIDWYQAKSFCVWAGGRLPSEAEWEYAARNGGQDIDHPWGNAAPTCDDAVVSADAACSLSDPSPVCTKPAGNTVHGLCDMLGNVREWVEDTWHLYTEAGRPDDGSAWVDPMEDHRVQKGAWWFSSPILTMNWARSSEDEYRAADLYSTGIRCARD